MSIDIQQLNRSIKETADPFFTELQRLVESHAADIRLFATNEFDDEGILIPWNQYDRDEFYRRESLCHRNVVELGISWDTFMGLVNKVKKEVE